jgi:acetolactate synthase-1/2/3 large subunit
MVDLDSGEMDKPGLNVVQKIRSNAREFIEQVLETSKSGIRNADSTEWIGFCNRIKSKYPLYKDISELSNDRFVDPFYFVGRMATLLPQDALIPYGSSGMAHTVFGGNYLLRKGQRVFCFKGLAAMGYGIPCTIGAAFAFPGRMTFTFIGEGGLQLNIQDLQTIRHHNLPVKVVVFNNGGYHSIHMTQNAFFAGHFVASGPESDVTFPALDEVARLYGFDFHRICRNSEVDDVFARVTADNRPTLVEILIDPSKILEPRISSIQKEDGTMESRPLEDMTPLVSREELRQDMLIPFLDNH